VRRAELESSDPLLFQEVVRDCLVGYLTLLTGSGYPRAIALNFAAIGQVIYFHGALAGEKFELISADPQAGFTMVKPYSTIPSYWTAPANACPATQFFKSVEIRGRCQAVTDIGEKARGLQALMEKHQPEGGFDPILPEVPAYRQALQRVGVFRVVPQSWTGKVKFGQNEPPKVRQMILEGLRKRGLPLDAETAREILRASENDGSGPSGPLP
jgi:nitroimidazol reductase NimA-like FMN-containing flavoprotein (pyridoxamine 5'-phosphate oxidase superfamily)